MIANLFEPVEPLLSYALEMLHRACQTGEEDTRRRLLHRAHEGADAARLCLELGRPPLYRAYDPQMLLRRSLSELGHAVREAHFTRVSPVTGDPDQVFSCIRLLVRAPVQAPDTRLALELLEDDDGPQVILTPDGPGRFPARIPLADLADVPFSEVESCWISATRGGDIDRTGAGLVLQMKGQRMIKELPMSLPGVLPLVREAEQHLRWLACAEATDISRLGEASSRIEDALALMDNAERGPEPGNIALVLTEALARCKPGLEMCAIVAENTLDPKIPPIMVRRERLLAFFVGACRHAAHILPRGGSLLTQIGYDEHERNLGIEIAISGTQLRAKETAYVASMRRAAAEIHGGSFDQTLNETCATLTTTVPDFVGRAMEEWIPGVHLFSGRSQQMLRLIKCSSTVSEALVLAGVLEEELERWLMPRLSAPPAVNVAHELEPKRAGLPGASVERLKKALDQVRRGKPRKEITEPAYAAELLWAYRMDERSRCAIGIEHLSEDELTRLCQGLLLKPPEYVACLRLIAKAMAPSPRAG